MRQFAVHGDPMPNERKLQPRQRQHQQPGRLTSANQPRVARTGNHTVKKYDNWKTTSRREAEYQEGG